MANPIFHSQYTAAQIEAAIGKGPRVNASGFWEIWNVANMAYESTGVGAGVTPPIVVTQASQMTNHGYVYIYNGNETGYTPGYWYYWDGSAWTAGGAYQVAATDPTLSVAGAAADAKAAGDDITRLEHHVFFAPYEPSNMTKVDGLIYLEMGYFAISTGKATASSNGKYYRSQAGYAGTGTLLQIGPKALWCVVGLDWIRWSCWSYKGATNADATHSNTGESYVPGTQAIYIPKNSIDTRFSLSFRKVDDTVFSAEDLAALKAAIRFYTATDSTLTARGAAADAKAVGDEFQKVRGEFLTEYTGSTPASVMDLPDNVWWVAAGSVISPTLGSGFTWTLAANTTYLLRKYKVATSAYRYELMSLGGRVRWSGYTISSSTAISWVYDQTAIENSVNTLRSDTMTQYTGSTPASAMDLPGNTWWQALGSVMQPTLGSKFTWDMAANTTYILRKYQITSSASRYELMSLGGAIRWTGYTISSSAAITWYYVQKVENRSLKLLAFGSSFTYSTLGLVPAVLAEIAPEIDLTLGILYISGGGIEDHIDKIENESTYTRYSEYTTTKMKWTQYANNTTAQAALARHDWDYIAVQPRASEWNGPGRDTPGAGLTTLETLEDLILGIVDYSFCLLYNIPQGSGKGAYESDGRAKSDALFADIVHFAEEAVKQKFVCDVLPGGTAAQNARHTSLTDIGVYGDMCWDHNSHLQNGIGTLVPAYAVAAKIMEMAGLPVKVLGVQLTPTDTWLADDYNLYTADLHGPCVGVTTANKLLGQKCAVNALKYPYVITDL